MRMVKFFVLGLCVVLLWFWLSIHPLPNLPVNALSDTEIGAAAEQTLARYIKKVSVSSAGVEGNGLSVRSSMSADGRYIAFESTAGNLVEGDTNTCGIMTDPGECPDVFVHDRVTGVTRRVSIASDGSQGNDWSSDARISANGRFVAFYSIADNLVPDDTNEQGDIFVHDLQTGQTTRVSIATDGTEANNWSAYQAISADGRYVAFESMANNLVAGDTNNVRDVFVYDRQTAEMNRVSVASNGTEGNGLSGTASISADGQFVAFYSSATNLVADDNNGQADVFLHDRNTQQTILISKADNGTLGNGWSTWNAISENGEFVAFFSHANNLVVGDTNGEGDVFLYQRSTEQVSRISVGYDGSEANGYSLPTFVAADGRYILFYSEATNIVPDDTSSAIDAFVHDRQSGVTTRVSVTPNGVQGNHISVPTSISSDGTIITFDSDADNLVTNDNNSTGDVFVSYLVDESRIYLPLIVRMP
ncbi:MAG: hypothetical protein H6658_11410 [Ardenticatenaceae bacterium]|nr:hypothetical protein [Ardenticatenaceae bacterium]